MDQPVRIVRKQVPPAHQPIGGSPHQRDVLFVAPVALFERRPRIARGQPLALRPRKRNEATGIRPKFYERLRASGMQLPASIFQTVVEIS